MQEDKAQKLIELTSFLETTPSNWSDPTQQLKRFNLSKDEFITCILWNQLFYITGTDIVKIVAFRLNAIKRVVCNPKKFEEGIFSDLRSMKVGVDAVLEPAKSPFLGFLFRNDCLRTQKKQKVFCWFSVSHHRLFMDALERDLKRQQQGMEPTTRIVNGNVFSRRSSAPSYSSPLPIEPMPSMLTSLNLPRASSLHSLLESQPLHASLNTNISNSIFHHDHQQSHFVQEQLQQERLPQLRFQLETPKFFHQSAQPHHSASTLFENGFNHMDALEPRISCQSNDSHPGLTFEPMMSPISPAHGGSPNSSNSHLTTMSSLLLPTPTSSSSNLVFNSNNSEFNFSALNFPLNSIMEPDCKNTYKPERKRSFSKAPDSKPYGRENNSQDDQYQFSSVSDFHSPQAQQDSRLFGMADLSLFPFQL